MLYLKYSIVSLLHIVNKILSDVSNTMLIKSVNCLSNALSIKYLIKYSIVSLLHSVNKILSVVSNTLLIKCVTVSK